MVKNKILFFIFLVFGITTNAQKVSNITFKQEQSNIVVSYDLETKTTCKIDLFVSTNGGTTWQGPLKKVIGDVGINISSGKKNIIWNVLEEFEELKGDNIKFQVKAIFGDLDTPMIMDKSKIVLFGSKNFYKLKQSKKIWMVSALVFGAVGTGSYFLSKNYYNQYQYETTDAVNLYKKVEFQNKIYPIAFGLAGFCGFEVFLKSRRLNKVDESHTSLNIFPLNNGGGIGLIYKF